MDLRQRRTAKWRCTNSIGDFKLAKRAGIKKILLPKRNEIDLEDVPKEVRDTMEFVLVEELSEVFLHALGKRVITPVLLGTEPAPRRANNFVALRQPAVKRVRVGRQHKESVRSITTGRYDKRAKRPTTLRHIHVDLHDIASPEMPPSANAIVMTVKPMARP